MKDIAKIACELSDELADYPKHESPKLAKGFGYVIEYSKKGKKIFERDIGDVSLPDVDSVLGKSRCRRLTLKTVETIVQSCFRSLHDIGYEDGPLSDKIMVLVNLRYEIIETDYDIKIISYRHPQTPAQRCKCVTLSAV